MSDEIKWDKSKHDRELKEKSEGEIKARILNEIGILYREWKQKLVKKPIRQDQLAKKVMELRESVMKKVVSIPALKDWADFTSTLFDDTIGRTINSKAINQNHIKEYVPKLNLHGKDKDELLLEGDLKKMKPRSFPFKTTNDFATIPFVAAMREKPGFVGFVLRGTKDEGLMLCGYFNDHDVVPCGYLDNTVGVAELPQEADLREALAAYHSTTADAGSKSTKPLNTGADTSSAAGDAPEELSPGSDTPADGGSPSLN